MNIFIPKYSNTISHTLVTAEPFGNVKGVKRSLSEINTGSPVFGISIAMDGTKHAVYHVNLIDLLDKVFLNDELNYISPEQERFILRFFKQAGIVNDLIDANLNYTEVIYCGKKDLYCNNGYCGQIITGKAIADIYADMDEVMRDLDNFLGSYYGEDNGRYAR